MGTLASNRKGFITGTSAANYASSLNVTSGTATDSATGNQNCIQYFRSSGRGGGTFRFIRTFIHFNTTNLTEASNISLQLTSAGGSTNSNFNVTAIKHDAGGGNGGALSSGDFNNIFRATAYSAATSFASSGTITFSLNAAAVEQINNNNDFNIALLLTIDALESEEDPLEEDGNITNSIAFSSAINLVYTEPAAPSGYSNTVNTVADDNIAKVNTVATANIGKVIAVD